MNAIQVLILEQEESLLFGAGAALRTLIDLFQEQVILQNSTALRQRASGRWRCGAPKLRCRVRTMSLLSPSARRVRSASGRNVQRAPRLFSAKPSCARYCRRPTSRARSEERRGGTECG